MEFVVSRLFVWTEGDSLPVDRADPPLGGFAIVWLWLSCHAFTSEKGRPKGSIINFRGAVVKKTR
jgi:hypothetical protein